MRGATAGVLLASALLAAGATPVAAAPSSADLVATDGREVWFSPNDDGLQDRAPVSFTLDEPAGVVVTVERNGRPWLPRMALGRLDAGRHTFRWDGLNASGRAVRDGRYVVVVRARNAHGVDEAEVPVVLRATDHDRLVTSRRTVHPGATLVHDRVEVAYLRQGWEKIRDEDPDNPNLWPFVPRRIRVTMEVVDREGAVLHRVSSKAYTPRFTWDGRRPDGTPYPPGRYRLQLRAVSAEGYVVERQRWVWVSDAQLEEEVWTRTGPASEARPYDLSFRVRDPFACPPEPSQRFPGGLHFGCWRTLASAVPFVVGAGDSYRVTVAGGPAVVGSSATGTLEWGFGPGKYLDLGPGDASATGPWTLVEPTRYPMVDDPTRPVLWWFTSNSIGGYDLATVTIEYRHYVPVP